MVAALTSNPPAFSDTISPNRALYERFMDLPRSKRMELQTQMEDQNTYWHFLEICKPGKDLGKTSIKLAVLLKSELNVTDSDLINNAVTVARYPFN